MAIYGAEWRVLRLDNWGRHRFYRNDKAGNMQENTTRIEERLDRLITDMSIIGQRVAAIEAKLDSVEEGLRRAAQRHDLVVHRSLGRRVLTGYSAGSHVLHLELLSTVTWGVLSQLYTFTSRLYCAHGTTLESKERNSASAGKTNVMWLQTGGHH